MLQCINLNTLQNYIYCVAFKHCYFNLHERTLKESPHEKLEP